MSSTWSSSASDARILSRLAAGKGVDEVGNAKAYEMLSNFNGLVDLYRLTGETRLLDAVLRAWQAS